MLKKIGVGQLQIGMYLHSFEGNWVSHPFWRTGFVLDDEVVLARARSSEVKDCWIDTSLGSDMRSLLAERPPADVEAAPGQSVVAPPLRTTMRDELDRAAKLCKTASAQVMHMFEDARLGRTLDARGCVPLVHEISESVSRHPGALLSLARLKTQDDYSYMHSVAVCALMIALGRQLGLDDAGCREAGLAGLLHDIGKAVVPSAILSKPGKLDEAEFAVIRTHPERGHELLVAGHCAAVSALDVCLHHHERMDGTGYPHGLGADEISLFARMAAVCDVYDAVTSDRPYKAGWDPADAIARMAQWEGHFDPVMMKAFIHSLGIYPIGSLVRLESRRVAVVVEQNAHAIAKPVVKVFFSLKSGMPIAPELLDLGGRHCSERVSALEAVDGWNQRDIAAMWAGDALPKGFRAPGRSVRRELKAR
jgi:HD-GYP domain-containing protein (c-di-GMP phosphodiesterase class II)